MPKFDPNKSTKNIVLVGLAIQYSKKIELGGKTNIKKNKYGDSV